MSGLAPVFEHDYLALSSGRSASRALQGVAANMAANGLHQKSWVNGFDDVPRPFFIGVAGGTASGKSTVCQKIMEQLGQHKVDCKKQQVVIVSMENFYRPLSEDDRQLAERGLYNFDHPSAFDEDFIVETLRQLKAGKTIEIPTYDAVNVCHQEQKKTVYPADVIIFEGLLAFYFASFREFYNMKLFVDTDADTRLSRRVMRDMKERGRELDQILHQYTTFVKPAFEEFCLPTKKYADVIIPRGADNIVAIDLIVQSVQDLLKPKKERAKRVRHNSDSLAVFRYSPPH